jgi:hypothetical protein
MMCIESMLDAMENHRASEETRRRRLLESSVIKNQGKTIEDEQNLCDTFVMTYHHPTFAYLIESEWEYIPGYSNHGAGDLVFSSSLSLETQSPSWNNLALTSSNLKPQILIVEAKYLQCDSGSTARTKRTKHRGKVKEQLLNSMSAWQRRYPSHDIFGAILSNDRDCCLGSKHVCTSSENDDIYLSPIVSFPDAMSLHTFDDCQVPYDGTPPKMGFGDPLPRAM